MGWWIWAGIEWIAALIGLLIVLAAVVPRLGFFSLSGVGQTVVIPQNRVNAGFWLVVCLAIALVLGQTVFSAPSYFGRFFQQIDADRLVGGVIGLLLTLSVFESQASYVRIFRPTGSLYARLSGWFGILPFTQRISIADIASLRAGHVTTRKTSNTQTGTYISTQTRYELILSGSFGARRLQFGSAEARDLVISVIQAVKRENGAEVQVSNEPGSE